MIASIFADKSLVYELISTVIPPNMNRSVLAHVPPWGIQQYKEDANLYVKNSQMVMTSSGYMIMGGKKKKENRSGERRDDGGS